MLSQDQIFMHERLRLLTFDNRWKLESSLLSPQNMAKQGFKFVQAPDVVQCVFCSVYLENWLPTDDPSKEHERCSPNCGWRKEDNISCEEENFDNNILRQYEERV